ncbi:DNA mismatch repair protein MutT [Planococcus glaciei]|uniref:NUDIX hydrolase n=1 Tax=Planococcus glaciei TaxID=459472 RepID=UPI00069E4D7C|nr:NUDIX hydrolase [Planococcus glaciei]KOF11671.1 DNA mismatch repair protein MutT [Planococcus glaciei]
MKRIDVVYVMLRDDSGEKLLMVKNYGDNGSYYTLPGGAVEAGETLQEAAIREAKEETGLDVSVGGLFSVSEDFFEERGHHAVFFIFEGQVLGGEITIAFPEEIEEVKWMPIQEAIHYLYIPEKAEEWVRANRSVPYILRGQVIQKR